MRAVRIDRFGGPEVMAVAEVERPSPGPGEILIRHEAIGLNFIDVYQRTGLYPGPLPQTLGREAAGVVEAVGEGVTRFQVGDRCAYAAVIGAYADYNVAPEGKAVKLPSWICVRTAASSLLKGMTAEFLACRIWPLERGQTVLVHAAAGGVGTLLTQWLSYRGLRVIGTVGSDAKAAIARSHGCAEVVVFGREDVAERVKALTGGEGGRVVYDSVGAATQEASLASLGKRGLLVSFGNASGPAPPVDPLRLSREGSLFLTRPTLFDYVDSPETLDASAAALFDAILAGAVVVEVGQEFPLDQAAAAHRALESRATTGATVLWP